MTTVEFELNGQAVIVDDVDPHCTLLEWLRASGRTGAKEGCAEGECGACAVAFMTRDASGAPRFDAVNSCLMPLGDAHGRVLVSVEGVAPAPAPGQPELLHPVQEALVNAGGSQCGYCTPGFVMSAFAEYYRPGRAGYDPEALGGNLCRCTGYRPIVEAARRLGPPAPSDPWLGRLTAAAPLPALSAPGGSFHRPASLAALFALLAEHPDATLLAGGTDLMVDRNQRHVRQRVLISLAALPELSQLQLGGDAIVVGAALPLSDLERALGAGADLRLLRELMPLFSSRLIRNRATLGGNLATASPIGDAAPVLLALDAQLELASARGTRRLPLTDYFLDYRKTALAAGELIVAIHIARPLARSQRFYKVSKRVSDDISSVSAAFALDLDAAGNVERLRVAYGGIAAVPLRASELEQLAVGRAWGPDTQAVLQHAAASLGTPLSDHRASAAYRRAMITSLLARFCADTAAAREAAP
ncbi:MAG TPA: FAD binding domain-containing protein [Polyangiaceae bacterium]|nr:FAD binding domain-containing protein [Polyangiaceae bacterium]